MNIHQLPFCEELAARVGDENFRFVASKQMDADRIQMGFEDMNVTKSFVIRAYESGDAYETAKRLAIESDVAIFGSALEIFQEMRMADNKLSFRYDERLFKKGIIRILDPRVFRGHYNHFTRYRNKNLYVLCASGYTKKDLGFVGFPPKKCFKWGYFPEMKPFQNFDSLRERKAGLRGPGVSILWAGRLIGWKHPELALSVAKHLKEISKEFSMDIIGDGPLRSDLEKKVTAFNLSDSVHLLGAQSHNIVLDKMEQADIFLFTSDRNEGWGAVLNEAMNSGCAIIADRHIGSAPFLIQHGKNGLLFSGKSSDLYDKIDLLISDSDLRLKMGGEAWNTINHQWDIKTATDNFFTIIEDLTNRREVSIMGGPCSHA